jgi:N-hydroxyarylamine O-acetyltransferase
MDIDAYLERIGHDGPRMPTLATLRALVAAHVASIPFENIDVLLEEPIRLDVPALELKLVQQRRGGYCFEQNTLFASVLGELGFEVVGLAARVLLAAGDTPAPPRSHMLLRVAADGQAWLVDVGFGRQSPTAPLPMRSDVALPTSHDTYRLAPHSHGLTLQARANDAWQALYRFTGERQEAVDYEVANFYVSQNPKSPFRQLLMMSRVVREGRHSLLNNRHSFRSLDGTTEERLITDAAALREVVCGLMGVATPARNEAFSRLLDRMAASPAT